MSFEPQQNIVYAEVSHQINRLKKNNDQKSIRLSVVVPTSAQSRGSEIRIILSIL